MIAKHPWHWDLATSAQIVLSVMALALCSVVAGDYLAEHSPRSICGWPNGPRPTVSEVRHCPR